MACPYFYPLEPDPEWHKHPRLPLGDPYTGLCQVDPLREAQPDLPTLHAFCNRGYARGRCPRFPAAAHADGHRFSVIQEEGANLRIFYVAERDHRPLDHGTIEYSTDQCRFVDGDGGRLFLRQAQAYIESYLRRKSEPEHGARNPHRR